MRSYETCQLSGALPITRVATGTEPDMLSPAPGLRMELPGFDPRYVDFPDYIFRITDDIWHQKQFEVIRDTYHPDCVIHTQTGEITGVQTVIDNTKATLVSFPDRRLDADNVIWTRDADPAGDIFYSSHRITSKMTNGGASEFGPATGRPVRVTTFAECATRENLIFEEWLVRDYGAMVEQMGHDPATIARARAVDDQAAGLSLKDYHARSLEGMGAHRAEATTENEDVILNLIKSGWSDASLYDYRARGDYPYARLLYGPDQIAAERVMRFAGLNDIAFRADHLAEVPYLGKAVDVALRWSMSAKHTGEGAFGAPTGETLYILGVSHFRMLDGVIREEATLWDDIGVKRMVEGIRLGL